MEPLSNKERSQGNKLAQGNPDYQFQEKQKGVKCKNYPILWFDNSG
jgi:hypothetical protein